MEETIEQTRSYDKETRLWVDGRHRLAVESEHGKPPQPPAQLSLYKCVDWRQWLWYLPTKWAIGNPERFRDKSLLEIGPGCGLMACYFASLGARVTAADCVSGCLDETRETASRLALPVRCLHFSGDYNDLPSGFDFVFTKSALVMTGQAATRAAQIPRLLRPGGEYIGVENLQGGWLSRLIRHCHHNATFPSRFSPITSKVRSTMIESFATVEIRHIFGPVIALRAIKSAETVA